MTTPAGIAAANAQHTDEAWLFLVEISGDNFAVPIRVANNKADVVHDGNTYQTFPFEVKLPSDAGDEQPIGQISMEDAGEFVDETDGQTKTMADIVRSIVGTPMVTVIVVLASDPEAIEMGPLECTMRKIHFIDDQGVINANLNLVDPFGEPCPADSFTPSSHPGMF